MDPRKIIEKHKADLVRRIKVETTALWEKVIVSGLFQSSDVKSIKVRFKFLL